MKNYICLEDAVDALRKYQYPYGVEFLISNLPKCDVAPVIHGKWEHTHTSESYFNECWRCSACGFDDTEGFGFKFCPNCGAKMDLEYLC